MFSRRSPKILLSYRRADTKAMAGWFAGYLKNRFGSKSVFTDVDDIPYGTDFRDHIHNTIKDCDVVVALIGSNWKGPDRDNFRINGPEDHPRIEIESALKAGITIIPVLVDNATMPSSVELPPSISRIAFLNAAPLDGGRDFEVHAERICTAIARIAARRKRRPDTVGGSVSNFNISLSDIIANQIKILWNYERRRNLLFALIAGIVSGVSSKLQFDYPLRYEDLSYLPNAIRKIIVYVILIGKRDSYSPEFWLPPYVFAPAVVLVFFLSTRKLLKPALIMVPIIILAWGAAFNTAWYINIGSMALFKIELNVLSERCGTEGGLSEPQPPASDLSLSEQENCSRIKRQNMRIGTVNSVTDWIASTVGGLCAGLVGSFFVLIGLALNARIFLTQSVTKLFLITGTLTGVLVNGRIFIIFELPSVAVLYVCWQASLLILMTYYLDKNEPNSIEYKI